jgi:ribosomal protein S16
MKRSDIKPHPQNPRVISDSARKRLNRGLDDVGLLEPLIVNTTTGHLLGGHQRLAWLDGKHKGKGKGDYDLSVALVEIPEKRELSIAALLNNEAAQGTWDLDVLHKQLADNLINLEAAGFDQVQLESMFPEDPELAPLFAKTSDSLEKLVGAVTDAKEIARSAARAKKNKMGKDDTELYCVVVFKSRKERVDFLKMLKLSPDTRYVSGETLADAM